MDVRPAEVEALPIARRRSSEPHVFSDESPLLASCYATSIAHHQSSAKGPERL
jgi:hypothetical protein